MTCPDWTARLNPQLHVAWNGAWRTGTVEPPRVLLDHELVLVERGSCRIEIDGAGHQVEAGCFLVIPPGAAHLTRVLAGPAMRLCFHFDWDWSPAPAPARPYLFLPERPPARELRPAPGWVPASALAAVQRAAPAAVAQAQRLALRWREGDRRPCRGLFLALLLDLFAAAAPAGRGGRGDALAQLVKARLDQGGLDDRSLRRELAALGHSYEHLCRVFTRTYGIPPLRYLTLAKVEQARALLAEPGASVAAVARRLGYADARYFARLYRRHAGEAARVSP